MVVIRRLASRTLTLLVACSPKLCSSCSKMRRHHKGSHGILWGWPPPQPNVLNEGGITGSDGVGRRALDPRANAPKHALHYTHVTATLAQCRQVISV
jgi:hypothetical protein